MTKSGLLKGVAYLFLVIAVVLWGVVLFGDGGSAVLQILASVCALVALATLYLADPDRFRRNNM